MIESWSDIILGIVMGVGATIIAILLFYMAKTSYKIMVWKVMWEHEEKYHAEEKKERDKQ